MALNVISAHPGTGARRHPLVFVHGAWHGAWCWERFLPWFAERGWECNALDLRGHGDSPNDRTLRRTRIRHYVDDLATVVDSLDELPILVGHSMGGLVVQRYLEDHDLPGAVLLAPVPIGGAVRATLRTMRRHPIAFLKANLTLDLGPLVASPDLAHDLFFAADTPADEVAIHWSRMQSESYLAYLDMLFFARPRPQLVHTPVAVVAGSQDRIFGVKELRKTCGAYGVELTVVEGAAHDLMLDPRWEQAAEAVSLAIESI
jgi:pimeloyl-ACP methyl ester carboxylesterase